MKKIISHHSCGVPNEDEDNNRPPTPWARSKSKQNIIDNLKDKNSDIHLLIGDYDDNDFTQSTLSRFFKHMLAISTSGVCSGRI